VKTGGTQDNWKGKTIQQKTALGCEATSLCKEKRPPAKVLGSIAGKLSDWEERGKKSRRLARMPRESRLAKETGSRAGKE